ncbi:polyamine-modulated factor 1-binding protein 1 [Drosophila tropicalis]|uniref:polyamine-modulated factor 1-binding protein 1 n=1 Tax=Drosophila tropicalis TaxID=46794 RepID=UPI0035ABC6DD
MDCHHRIEVPLRSGGGGKKMKKRRELDALIAHSTAKRNTTNGRRAMHSQDKLLSVSTDDPEDYVWTNVSGSSRRSHRKNNYFRTCGPVLIGITSVLIVAILYWLYFDLRQQISDYRHKIEEVSAISKNFPDTLQKWHETSSFLLKNQTAVITQINDLRKTVDSLRTNFSSLEATVNAQRNHGQDEKMVADFGAKIEAVATDIEEIKDHYNRYMEVQKIIQSETAALKSNLSQLPVLHAANSPNNFSEEISALNQTFENSFKQFQNDLKDVNNTYSQTTKMLRDEILVHKTKLDDLLDRSENITSHVATLSNSWPEYKQKILNVDESLDKIEKEMLLTKSMNNEFAVSIKQLKNLCRNHLTPKPIESNNDILPITQSDENVHDSLMPLANATSKLKESSPL